MSAPAIRPFSVLVVLLATVGGMVVLDGCSNRAGGGVASVERGQKYFQLKCNSCHPGGGQGAGPTTIGKPLPGPLRKTANRGRHNVPPGEWDSLMLYLTPLMAGTAGGAPATAAAPMPAASPAPMPPPPAPPPASTSSMPAQAAPPASSPAAPVMTPAPGMKLCNCTCQCPAGTPPGQMQSCTCACGCPPG